MGSQMPPGISQIWAVVPHLLTASSRSAKAHQRFGEESRVVKTGWGWAGRSGEGTCEQWDGHTGEQQDTGATRDRKSWCLPGRAGRSRAVVSARV